MAKYCIIPTIWYSGNIKTMDTAKKKKISGCQGLGLVGWGRRGRGQQIFRAAKILCMDGYEYMIHIYCLSAMLYSLG